MFDIPFATGAKIFSVGVVVAWVVLISLAFLFFFFFFFFLAVGNVLDIVFNGRVVKTTRWQTQGAVLSLSVRGVQTGVWLSGSSVHAKTKDISALKKKVLNSPLSMTAGAIITTIPV